MAYVQAICRADQPLLEAVMRSFNPNFIPRPGNLPSLQKVAGTLMLDIEIGAGQGLHALRYARENSDRTLIAIERTRNRFDQLKQRVDHHPGLPNLIALNADAVSVFVHALENESVDRVFLLYPNPYPKSKQANLRWYNMPFMSLLRQKMRPGGSLTLATNMKYYAAECEEQMVKSWGFCLKESHQLPTDSIPRTHFEKKYLARGEACWNLVFVKP